MPTLEVSFKDMQKLIGRNLTIKQLEEELLYAKSELDGVEGDLLKIDCKDTNRPELWSAEGIAREIRLRHRPANRYKVGKSGLKIKVDAKVKNVRPEIACMVVKGLKITENVLSQMIQLQEKISMTYGRNRKEVAIGVYDYDKIKPPITYTTIKPNGIKFVPLEFEEEMTPAEILRKHPKGLEYRKLLAGYKEYPLLIDNKKNVLSMPPIINSDYTGKVTSSTTNLFVECTGYNMKYLMPAINALAVAFMDRNAKVESVRIGKTVTPDMTPKRIKVNLANFEKVAGFKIDKKLLEKAGYKVAKNYVEYPGYRQDIMHERDVIEDAIISYGYNNIEPTYPELATIGSCDKSQERFKDIMIGLGFQEILSYTLTNKENLFAKMNRREERISEIENPISKNWNVFRNYMIPSLMELLAKNQHVELPHRVFEIGTCVINGVDVQKMAALISDQSVNYSSIASCVDVLMKNLGIKYKLKEAKDSSFIEGRCATIVVKKEEIGIVGEIHPKVLGNWGIGFPVVGFEVKLLIVS
jgi:phenylalanyl-tRNA synthetase beta chain